MPQTPPQSGERLAGARAFAPARNRVADAYERLAARPGSPVQVADLRDAMPDLPREEFDAELRQMERDRLILLTPQSNQKVLTERQRRGAVDIGGQDNHLVLMERSQLDRLRADQPNVPVAPPQRTPSRRSGPGLPEGLVDRIRAATSREQVRDLLEGLTVSRLRQVAADLGIAVATQRRKADLVNDLVFWTVGRTADAAAISRPSFRPRPT